MPRYTGQDIFEQHFPGYTFPINTMQEFATTGSRPTCTYMPQTTYIPTLHGRNPRMQDAYMGLQTYTSQTEKATHRALSPNARDYFSWRLGQIDTQPASALEHKNLHYKVGSSARYSPSVQSYTMDTFNDDPDDYGALSHHLAAHMHNNTTSHAKLMYEESAVPGVLKAVIAAAKGSGKALKAAEHATVAAGKSAAHAAAKKMTTNKALEAASKKVPKKSKLLVYDTDDSSSDDNKTSSENDEEAHEGDKHHKADNKDIRQNTKDKKRLKMLLAEIAIIHSRHA